MKYHIWTEGCQMNVADSQRVGSSLEAPWILIYRKSRRSRRNCFKYLRRAAICGGQGDWTPLLFAAVKTTESKPRHQSNGMSGGCTRRGEVARTTSLCGCVLAPI